MFLDVPRCFREDKAVIDADMQQAIGQLIQESRVERGFSQLRLAKEAGVDVKTLRSMEDGSRWASDVTRAKIEQVFGWRKGAMQDLWNDREHLPLKSVTLTELQRGAGEPTWEELETEDAGKASGPVRRASQLTDEELLAELSYRFRTYKDQLHEK